MRLLYLQLPLAQDHFHQCLLSRQMKQVEVVFVNFCTVYLFTIFSFFIAAPSGIPHNFSASVVTSHSLSLIWNPPLPENQNGVIIRYTVNITVLATIQMFQLFSDNNSITVSSLSPYTTYSFIIAAETAVGVGPFSGAYTVMTATDGKKHY